MSIDPTVLLDEIAKDTNDLDRLQQQLAAKRAALSGRQSTLNALRDEASVQNLAGARPAVLRGHRGRVESSTGRR